MFGRLLAAVLPALMLASASLVPARAVHAFPASADGALLDGDTLITTQLDPAVDISGATPAVFKVTDTTTGTPLAVTSVTALNGATTGQTDTFHLQLGAAPDITHTITLSYNGTGPVTVFPRDVLNETKYFYGGNDLGALYSSSDTTFRVWAPVASAVNLVVYKDRAGDVLTDQPMTRSDNGTWFAQVSGDLSNMYYFYRVTNLGHTRSAMDPYAVNIPPNGRLSGNIEGTAQGYISQIVNLAATDPPGWNGDTYRKTTHPTEASIYEVHVRDFSIDPNSGMQHRGKYLAFTETGTKSPAGQPTGADSLKQLGITHVELLPNQRCASLDEVSGGSIDPAPGGSDRYNWCYDPVQYNVLNGAYATNPDGTARITEYKQMVMALHHQGLGVIQDVVYPHTGSNQSFDPLVPRYYYRTTNSGAEEMNSGAGPDVAAERPMVRKFILDSIAYLMKEYHIDGFRFDQMTLLGKGTLAAISQEVHQINPSTILLGEEFDQHATLEGDTQVTFGVQKDLHVGGLNYDMRHVIRGDNAGEAGYADGNPGINGPAPGVQVVGNIDYSGLYNGWTDLPEEAINYAGNHDGQTLWDAINAANSMESDATRIKMDELSEAMLFTSQGVPFMQGGDELLRTKGGNDNSYNAGDAVNELDWSRKSTFSSVFTYYAGLIHLRAAHPAFQMDDPAAIKKHLKFLKSKTFAIGFELTAHANKDKWKNIVVIYNPLHTAVSFSLPKGSWTVVAKGAKIGQKSQGKAKTKVSVPAYSAMVLHQ